jgi:hypothetical protein
VRCASTRAIVYHGNALKANDNDSLEQEVDWLLHKELFSGTKSKIIEWLLDEVYYLHPIWKYDS